MGFFKKIIFHTLATTGVFWGLETHAFPETLSISGGFESYFLAAVIFGVLNATIKPILKILTFPIKILTLGISSIFLNAGLLWTWAEVINFLEINGTKIEVADFQTYVLAGVLLAIANFLLHWLESK